MGETTGISWAQATWNPWQGCRKLSPACRNCYMYRDMERYGKDPRDVRRSKTTFNTPLTWKEPKLIFTCSWSDWFIEEADAWRDEAWDIIRRTPHHTYQILTKRTERIADRLPPDWPLKNAWLGASVETDSYRQRITELCAVPATVHFLSCEPLLAHLHLEEPVSGPTQGGIHPPWYIQQGIDWIIGGGESGPNARPTNPDWARSLRDQAIRAGIPFHWKQWGEWAPSYFGEQTWEPTETTPHHYFEDHPCRVWRIGREKSGRLLDGVLWDQMPQGR